VGQARGRWRELEDRVRPGRREWRSDEGRDKANVSEATPPGRFGRRPNELINLLTALSQISVDQARSVEFSKVRRVS
jgi:hypothetical protein